MAHFGGANWKERMSHFTFRWDIIAHLGKGSSTNPPCRDKSPGAERRAAKRTALAEAALAAERRAPAREPRGAGRGMLLFPGSLRLRRWPRCDGAREDFPGAGVQLSANQPLRANAYAHAERT